MRYRAQGISYLNAELQRQTELMSSIKLIPLPPALVDVFAASGETLTQFPVNIRSILDSIMIRKFDLPMSCGVQNIESNTDADSECSEFVRKSILKTDQFNSHLQFGQSHCSSYFEEVTESIGEFVTLPDIHFLNGTISSEPSVGFSGIFVEFVHDSRYRVLNYDIVSVATFWQSLSEQTFGFHAVDAILNTDLDFQIEEYPEALLESFTRDGHQNVVVANPMHSIALIAELRVSKLSLILETPCLLQLLPESSFFDSCVYSLNSMAPRDAPLNFVITINSISIGDTPSPIHDIQLSLGRPTSMVTALLRLLELQPFRLSTVLNNVLAAVCSSDSEQDFLNTSVVSSAFSPQYCTFEIMFTKPVDLANCISLSACLLVTAVRRIVSIDISLPRLCAASSCYDAAIAYENQQLESNCSLHTCAELYSNQKSQKRPYRALDVSVEEVALELLPRGKRARVCDDNSEFGTGTATEAPDLHNPVQVTVQNFDENSEIISTAFEADNNFHPYDDVLDSFLHLKGAGSHPGMSARLSRRVKCLVTLHQTTVDSILAFSCVGQAPLVALQSCGIIPSNIDMDSISVQYCERILKQIDSESQISVVGQSTDLNFQRQVLKNISLLHLLLLLKDLLTSCGIRVAYEFWQVALEHWNLKSILGSELDPKTEVGKIREILDKLHSFVEQDLVSDHPKFEKLAEVLNSNQGLVIVVARHHSMVEAVIRNVSGLHPIIRLQDFDPDKPMNALCIHETHIAEVPSSIWQSAKCIVFLESLSDDEIDSLPVCSSETCIIELVSSCDSMNTKILDQNLDLNIIFNCKSILIQDFVRFCSENRVSVITRDLQFEDVVIDGQHSAVILDLETMSEGHSGWCQFLHQLNVMLLRYRYIHCIVDFGSHSFKSVCGKGFQEFNSLLNSCVQKRQIQLLFCENRSEIIQSIMKIALKSNASSLASGSHFEMQETLLEQWLTGFPSINPVLAQQIISVAPIRNFMEMNLSEKVALVQSSRVLESFHDLVEKDFGKVRYQRPSRIDYGESSISPAFQDDTSVQTIPSAPQTAQSLQSWNSKSVPPSFQIPSSKGGPKRASVESLAKSFFANLTSSVNAPLNSVAPPALQLPPPVAPPPAAAPAYASRSDFSRTTAQARQHSATRHDISVQPNTPVWHDVPAAGSAEVSEFEEFLKWKQMQQTVHAPPPAPRSGLPTRPDAAISRPFVPSFEPRRESTLDRGFAAPSLNSKRMRSEFEAEQDYGPAPGRQSVAPATVTPGALSFLDSFKLQRNAVPIPQAKLRDPHSNIDLRSPFARNNRLR